MVFGFSETWVQIQDFLSLWSRKSCLKSLLSMGNKDATLGGLFWKWKCQQTHSECCTMMPEPLLIALAVGMPTRGDPESVLSPLGGQWVVNTSLWGPTFLLQFRKGLSEPYILQSELKVSGSFQLSQTKLNAFLTGNVSLCKAHPLASLSSSPYTPFPAALRIPSSILWLYLWAHSLFCLEHTPSQAWRSSFVPSKSHMCLNRLLPCTPALAVSGFMVLLHSYDVCIEHTHSFVCTY